jgi:hypothetical protein
MNITKQLPNLKKRPSNIVEWEAENIKHNYSGLPLSQHTCYLGVYQIRPCGVSDIDYSRVGRKLTKF